jgi:hypothetical protein
MHGIKNSPGRKNPKEKKWNKKQRNSKIPFA